jgi:hypothetical protein
MDRSQPTCLTCGRSLPNPILHAAGDETIPYCRCCADADGKPCSDEELTEALAREAIEQDGLNEREAREWAQAEVQAMHASVWARLQAKTAAGDS